MKSKVLGDASSESIFREYVSYIPVLRTCVGGVKNGRFELPFHDLEKAYACRKQLISCQKRGFQRVVRG